MSDQPAAAAAPGTEIEPTEEGVLEFRLLYDPDLDFRKLALESQYHARGFRRIEKNWICAVPIACCGVTYREGFVRDNVQGDYISLEAVVADKDILELPQVRLSYAEAHEGVTDLYVFPNEPIVFNDGGTGVRRTITKLLDDVGAIDVGGKADDPRRYDRPFSLWKAGAAEAQVGFTAFPNGKPFRYFAARGLRRSDYDSPYGPATTFYFG